MRYVLLALFYLLAQPTFAWAEASDADKAQFRQIISDQMAAFRAGDAAAAFGFASPALQAKFGSAAMFMEMVRDGYQPVYRPKRSISAQSSTARRGRSSRFSSPPRMAGAIWRTI